MNLGYMYGRYQFLNFFQLSVLIVRQGLYSVVNPAGIADDFYTVSSEYLWAAESRHNKSSLNPAKFM
jgi:hypothetical protein